MSSILVLLWPVLYFEICRPNKAHHFFFFNRAPMHFAVNNKQANCQLASMTGWTCPPSSCAPERRFPFSFPFERLPHRLIANRKVLLFCGLPGYSWPIEFLITGCERYISVNSFFVGFSSIYKRQGDTYHGFYALVPRVRPGRSVKIPKRANRCFSDCDKVEKTPGFVIYSAYF